MKKILASLLLMLVIFSPIEICGLDSNTSESIYYKYLEDGSYYEITISENTMTRASSTKTATKRAKYVNSSNVTVWEISVTGTFTYNGTSSTCTASSVAAKSYSTNWKITSQSASKSENKAIAKATAKYYYDGSLVTTASKTVTLTCDKNGNLS